MGEMVGQPPPDFWEDAALRRRQAETEAFNIHSPGVDPEGRAPERRVPSREIRVIRPTYEKLNLKVLKDESDFKVWRTSLELSLDEHWMGLQDVLAKVRLMKAPCDPDQFENLIQTVALRPADARLEDWSHRTRGRFLYGVLYHFTSGTLQNLVEEEERTKDGVESFRKLCAHCDPLNLYTGANKLMKAIVDMGHVRVSTIDDLLAALKETKKRIAEYEERVTVLPDAKTTWIPSMMTELMDEEVLTHLEKDGSQNDLEKMIRSVEALRVIKRSVTRKGGQLRQLATEGPSQDAEDDEQEMSLDEIAAAIADPTVPRDQLLAALGKGGGNGVARLKDYVTSMLQRRLQQYELGDHLEASVSARQDFGNKSFREGVESCLRSKLLVHDADFHLDPTASLRYLNFKGGQAWDREREEWTATRPDMLISRNTNWTFEECHNSATKKVEESLAIIRRSQDERGLHLPSEIPDDAADLLEEAKHDFPELQFWIDFTQDW